MSTNWDGEFKKLYEDVSDSWLMLPLLVRGIGCEVLRVSNRVSGKVGDTRDTRALLRKLGGEASDAALVESAVTALLEQGFLMQDSNGALFVTNLAESQREQRAKWAEKKRNQRAAVSTAVPSSPPAVPDCPPVSPPVHETVPLSPREGEGEGEGDPPVVPQGPEQTENATRVPCPPGLALTGDEVAQLAMAAVPADLVPLATAELRAKWVNSHARRTTTEWRNYLRKAVTTELSDPKRRREYRARLREEPDTESSTNSGPRMVDPDELLAYQESL